MSRSKTMTIGFLLVLIGAQLNLVQTYTLTETATRFWIEHLEDPGDVADQSIASPFAQASFPGSGDEPSNTRTILIPAKQLTPPDWICWPFIFIGAALVIHGGALKRS